MVRFYKKEDSIIVGIMEREEKEFYCNGVWNNGWRILLGVTVYKYIPDIYIYARYLCVLFLVGAKGMDIVSTRREINWFSTHAPFKLHESARLASHLRALILMLQCSLNKSDRVSADDTSYSPCSVRGNLLTSLYSMAGSLCTAV